MECKTEERSIMGHSKTLKRFPKMKYFCSWQHCTCVFYNQNDLYIHEKNGSHVYKSLRTQSYEIMERIAYSSNDVYCPQMQNKYIPFWIKDPS